MMCALLLRFFCGYKKMSITEMQLKMKTERRMRRSSVVHPI